jgi:chromosome segregation ATPase
MKASEIVRCMAPGSFRALIAEKMADPTTADAVMKALYEHLSKQSPEKVADIFLGLASEDITRKVNDLQREVDRLEQLRANYEWVQKRIEDSQAVLQEVQDLLAEKRQKLYALNVEIQRKSVQAKGNAMADMVDWLDKIRSVSTRIDRAINVGEIHFATSLARDTMTELAASIGYACEAYVNAQQPTNND